MMKKVIVIVGPTGSGKTKYSVKLAKKINGEIINGDSVQIYKELNIGSAKIKEHEMENIKHHLFSIKHVGEEYSAFNFQTDARKLINDINTPILVGGTGFYIKSALYDYEFNKEEENDLFIDKSNLEIYEELIKLDKNIEIDKDNRVRLVRALNLAKSGNLRSEKSGSNNKLFDIFTIYLDVNRVKLKELLIKRLDIMINSGLIEEAKMLFDNNIFLNIIGYRELHHYFLGEYTLEEAKTAIIRSSLNLAKKQKTWFINQMNTTLYDPFDEDTENQIYSDVISFLKE
ncbi:tRNA (adenosine(37)-N6)-dimethylallyltransferase MiaA [Haploplasma modicum]|uniref:tRNA (adenosine(37)-N6)-dimethylallyltransferase MiaA n=1 Tax=Haploplasma modicum TaxID=2150 RepID=UPI000A00397C|nr:tRNA (adenosine(37)-N6)-dimethylallyltransferase MiaA [Haploplasma modicum]